MRLFERLVDDARHGVRYFLLRRLPTCQALAPLLSESVDRPLTLRERVVVRLHLWVCVWCDWYLRQVQVLHDAGVERGARSAEDDGDPEVSLSTEARERIRRALAAGR